MESDEPLPNAIETTESKKALEAGDVQKTTLDEGQQNVDEDTKVDEPVEKEHVEGEIAEGEFVEGEQGEGKRVRSDIEGEIVDGEHVQGETGEVEQAEGEHVEGEHAEGEDTEGEHVEGEHVEGEHVEGEHTASEYAKSEYTEGEQTEGEHREGEGDVKVLGEGEEIIDEEQVTEEEKKEETPYEPMVEEEEAYVEEPPPDPAAPYNFSDSQELLKEPFQLRPDQLAEVEQLWEVYQDYNPAYTDLNGFITEKELIYMLKCLLLMTYTPEQLQELISFCVRPPHPEGHITYEQFLRMVTIRQRDFPVEEELRAALQVLGPGKEPVIDRAYLREVLSTQGHKMPPRVLEHLIKEVDISNDGTIGIEDVVGTMCIDLNREDIIMLRQTLFPEESRRDDDDDDDDN